MAKKKPVKEEKTKVREADEPKDKECKEDGEADPADHPDADKDVELIKKVIAQHLGDKAKGASPEEMEALEGLAKEAYEAHKEMGKDDAEAQKCAGQAVELAHHMSGKKPKKEDAQEGDDKKEDPPAKEAEEAMDEKDEKEEPKESKREKELEQKLLETEGRLAALEAKDKKNELQRHVDAKLKESGQPSSITKRFREAAGEMKTKEDFDTKWKVFLAGVEDSRGSFDLGLLMEKATTTEKGERVASEKGFDFSKCAE